ncbi:MAG: PEP/pyruvate-binding domain-containing protein [Propioniciclava sp.]|uniref:PEP/pyruvate-binding domain-containing protein n=1 Tax=Propioniciclava sp. TaxID=2038686 RepID=UPI0039E4FAEC
MILWFDDITGSDAVRVGGKGANLGACARAGFPVPRGFCVTTNAYTAATAALAEQLSADVRKGAASEARRRIQTAPMPVELREAIADAYARLGEPAVAVRSSATAEDLADASFAGQQDSFLGIVGLDAVLDGVRRCWASLWTERAIDYRRRHGVPDEGLALAVVVQTMIEPDAAGVLFTRDPVTGDDTTMLVGASYGLGESVVAGLVTPDTFRLARAERAVTGREIGAKQLRIDAVPGGGTVTTDVAEDARARPSVTDAQLLRLLDLGERVEAHYGAPQDVEWALVGDDLFLLQSRPITSTAPSEHKHEHPRSMLHRLIRDDLIEHYPAPFPLDVMATHAITGGAMVALGITSAPASSLIIGDPDGIVTVRTNHVRVTPALVLRLLGRLAAGLRRDPFAWPDDERVLRRRLDALASRAAGVRSAPDAEVIRLVRDAVEEAGALTGLRFVRYLTPLVAYRTMAAGLLGVARSGREVSPEDLFAGVAYKTAEVTSGVQELAARARRSGVAEVIVGAPGGGVRDALGATAVGEAFQQEVEAFLALHGARTARAYLPFSNRSWREDIEGFYALLAAASRGEQPERRADADIAGTIEQRLPRFLRRCWWAAVGRLRALHLTREATVYLIEEFLCLGRAGVDELARRLVERGVLDDPGEVRFLYFDEIVEALRHPGASLSPAVVLRRRRRGAAEAAWWDRGAPANATNVLRGLPASAGRASGRARIIRTPDDFGLLQPGEVLVCPYTDPTWTPLFSLAAAVVADTGGPLSHAAIVAREYGIPAVLGTVTATSLADGVLVTVDGTKGTLTIETGPAL